MPCDVTVTCPRAEAGEQSESQELGMDVSGLVSHRGLDLEQNSKGRARIGLTPAWLTADLYDTIAAEEFSVLFLLSPSRIDLIRRPAFLPVSKWLPGFPRTVLFQTLDPWGRLTLIRPV